MADSCPNQPKKQRPREDEARQAADQAARPELQRPAEIPARVEGGQAGGHGRGRDAEDVDERGGQEGQGKVEEEARVGFEAEDAGADAEEGGRQPLEVGQRLEPVEASAVSILMAVGALRLVWQAACCWSDVPLHCA